ncbi:MAG TPA: hypothetical protein VGR45_10605, partial [Stellaceae bacterium]|nr:hypothetical protein [Stellaceae bacterium]
MGTIDLRPVLGRRSQRKSGARFLLVCLFDPAGITTIYENIALWQHFSRHAIEILNLWPGRGANLTIPATIDLDDYDGVIVHCAVSYHPDNLYSLDRNLARPFEEYDGLKILMKQDEHFHTAKFAAYIGKKRFDLVITCVSPEEREKAYPRRIVGGADFLQVFTGYVSPYMRSLSYEPAARRPLDVAYRGSIQPLSFGRLGFEKRKIGCDVGRIAPGYPLKT